LVYLFYNIDKTLGQGTFGKVKLAINDKTGQKVAIKILEKKKIVDVSDI
jgi:5'-AMP-activated protein kinase catalytic alpha subunit